MCVRSSECIRHLHALPLALPSKVQTSKSRWRRLRRPWSSRRMRWTSKRSGWRTPSDTVSGVMRSQGALRGRAALACRPPSASPPERDQLAGGAAAAPAQPLVVVRRHLGATIARVPAPPGPRPGLATHACMVVPPPPLSRRHPAGQGPNPTQVEAVHPCSEAWHPWQRPHLPAAPPLWRPQ